MESKDKIQIRGHFEIRSVKGELLAEAWNKEVVGGLNLLGQLLVGAAGFTGLTFQAIGTGATALSPSQTQLATETARNMFSLAPLVTSGSSTATITIQTFFPASQCSVNIQEVGLFGNGATSAANSGTMFNRALVPFNNSSLMQDLVFTATLVLSSAT